jgi:hypothetical protein
MGGMNALGQADLQHVLRVAEAAVGIDFLAYVFACPRSAVEELGAGAELKPGQAAVAQVLREIVEFRLPQELDESNRAHVLRALLIQTDANGAPVARHLHEQAGGTRTPLACSDPIETALADLAVDSFSAFLLPPDEPIRTPMNDVSYYATSLIFRHPQSERFSEAVLEEPSLSGIFSSHDDQSGWTALVYRNTGQGGGLQLSMMSDLLLRSAWRRLPEEARSSQSFAEGALAVWRLVRDVLLGATRSIDARFSFTGVLLPRGTRLELSEGVLREATPTDRRVAPESLKQQLTTTDAAGISTVINYDGDVIFQAEVPFKVETMRPSAPNEAPAEWPPHLRMPDSLERSITRLRSSLVLSAPRDHRVQIVPTWRYFEDPLSWGYAASWFDSRNAAGLVPTTLTEGEVMQWMRWYRLLDAPEVVGIEVALTRILRAIGERREPSDVLIDSVIAWENLFGTSEGEPTLRVTASLALLLEEEPSKRQELRADFTKIYNLRSKVVHGSQSLKASEFPLCYDALEIAIKALRTLIENRRDILVLANGGARSLRLILEG